MAMYVGFQKNAPHGQKEEYIWHVGERKPYSSDMAQKYGEVISVYADGDELDEILLRIEGIPVAKHKRSQTWRNDFAKFIWENI